MRLALWIGSALSALATAACTGTAAVRDAGIEPSMRWSVQALAGAPSLRGLSVPSADVAWASGTNGTVVRTVDGGESWSVVSPADSSASDFRSIVAFDSMRAVVATAGAPARVLRTVDGGASWSIVFEDPRQAAFFDALAFADERRGYLLGDPQDGATQMFETVDGGATWNAVPQPFLPTPIAGEAMFAASCGCLIATDDLVAFATGGSACRFLVSTSGARGFRASPLPLRSGAASQGAFAIARCGEDAFVAVGGDYVDAKATTGSACWSADGGATWQRSAGEPGYRSSVCAIGSGATLLSVGPDGASWSRDGGRSFAPLADEGFHAVRAFADSVFAVGSDGRIGTMRIPSPLSEATSNPR